MACMPSPLKDTIKRCYPALLVATHTRLPIFRLRGPSLVPGHQANVIAVGWSEYLAERFFGGAVQKERLGEVSVWNLERKIQTLEMDADLVTVRVEWPTRAMFFRRNYLVVPSWVGLSLAPANDPSLCERPNRSLESDLRRIRKGNYETEVSHSIEDFRCFYEHYYLPFVRRRHGSKAHIRDEFWLRHRFGHGGLIWVLRQGIRVACQLFETQARVMKLWALGTRDGDLALHQQGALSALYLNAIRYAHRWNCERVDFGLTRPGLKDGLLRYKAKWCTALEETPENYHCFLVQWKRWSPAVTAFFAEMPLIYRSGGGLSGLTAVPGPQPAGQKDVDTLKATLWVNGLQQLSVLSPGGWQKDVVAPPGVVLAGPELERDICAA